MKKIYSFVLMATMLFVGTNAWAAGSLITDVQAAFDSETATGYQLQPNGELEYLQFNGQLVFEKDKHFVLDLNGLTLQMNNNGKVGILVNRGTLEIKNGKIENVNSKTIDLIRVIGDYNTGWDAANGNTYSRLIIDDDAYIVNNVQRNTSTKYNALTITENPTKVGGNSYANGARIDVYGKATDDEANVDGFTYGIKVNGSIQRPASDADASYVYIHAGAIVTANNTNSGSAAAYSSGFARWRVEGTCEGSTGLYVKGGQIEVADNAVVKSNNPGDKTTSTGLHSGVDAGGSAIVVESNAAYPGQITVVISGNATVEGNGGYAIEETVDNAVAGTKVETISIQGGTIDGGDKGAIIVDEKTNNNTEHHVTVVGGTVDGTLAIETPDNTQTVEEFIQGTSTTDPAEEADYLVTKDTDDPDNPVYIVEPNTSKVVTLNAYGMTTFSAPYNRAITHADRAAGLKAYVAEYTTEAGEQVLNLTPITTATDTIINANTGVILMGTANQTYSLKTSDAASSESYTSALSAATEWSTSDDPATKGIIEGAVHANAYVLSGDLMYKYEGANMKANKAYLDLGSSPAPKRIRMVIAETEETQGIEDTEATVKALKFIENGQVLIKRGERVYNVQGQIVK